MANEKTTPAANSCDFAQYTNKQLRQALCLLVKPEWLRERAVMVAVLQALDYNSEDVAEVLETKQPLHDGPQLAL